MSEIPQGHIIEYSNIYKCCAPPLIYTHLDSPRLKPLNRLCRQYEQPLGALLLAAVFHLVL